MNIRDQLLTRRPCIRAEKWLKPLPESLTAADIYAQCPSPSFYYWVFKQIPEVFTENHYKGLYKRALTVIIRLAQQIIPDLAPARLKDMQLIAANPTEAEWCCRKCEQDAREDLKNYAFDLLKATKDARKYVILDAVYTAYLNGAVTWDSRLIAPRLTALIREALPFKAVWPAFESVLAQPMPPVIEVKQLPEFSGEVET